MKKISSITLFLCFSLASLAFTATVDRVIDGDTFVLDSGDKVRLLGVDCPEAHDPNKPVEYFSAEATQFMDSLIGGK